ncbi:MULTISPECIES: nitroreductase family protein [Archaeoglobus]|jgi:nitroreductase|uniref:Putative NADH dehydrogenase/NAD(P)H nitroreductase AF_2267 n=3 Tax=Archaeoglobus fulgidus TaxID=2234 RepID=Y2267_ARCFU|nr:MULTISPECIES: nitroreductase family protein [Archaeoglobus]O28017.1 RecName: Full=Putative NADH dehydrogenase/NAD(P)H nitroreductase AF_2267 [Archaeoglobus fulgidus DSM 4304]AAB88993.1 NAD(P)H-flavin oxidoreductase [Archaeoglobus fulgidus DSM 4304]AIG99276.1 Nitroreductase [Archaeoglobus fulgidus DSM 8774]KUJ93275.1 MAG: Putative NADH dehydrogenase/NAD(P)H nitroreductase [Archaeoglobus fulgidus]KUK06907.1 MAG: Putative NADH dehydrogenase/NAD(P)H nitroreductase [Archaeoglobus fulgidus]MDI34
MEECLKMIYTRRSIRVYSDRQISDEDIEKILKAAMLAPSAGNEQPWHFIVVRDREMLKKMSEAFTFGQMLPNASAAIVVCADPKLSKYPYDMWVQDCSAATENILLAARCLGIGSVWLGVYPREERMKALRELLGIPENIVVFSVVSLGYPKDEKDFYEADDRFNPDRIHREKW